MKVEPARGRYLARGLQIGAVSALIAFSLNCFPAGRIWVQETVSNVAENEIRMQRGYACSTGVLDIFAAKIASADTGPGSGSEEPYAETGESVLDIRTLSVIIRMEGQDTTFVTDCRTIKELLSSREISLGKYDRLYPAPETELKPGMLIKIVRVAKNEILERVPIKAKTVFVRDHRLYRGQSKVMDAGRNGQVEKRILVYSKDGRITLRKALGRKVVEAPRKRVVAIGTRYAPVSRYSREAPQGGRCLMMRASAYDPGPGSCGPYANGYTSIGLKAGYGVVAVDPRVIPMRSRLYIEGYGYAIAGDVGGAIKGNRIDLGYDTRAEALRFGRRNVKVYVLD